MMFSFHLHEDSLLIFPDFLAFMTLMFICPGFLVSLYFFSSNGNTMKFYEKKCLQVFFIFLNISWSNQPAEFSTEAFKASLSIIHKFHCPLSFLRQLLWCSWFFFKYFFFFLTSEQTFLLQSKETNNKSRKMVILIYPYSPWRIKTVMRRHCI